MYKLLRTHLLQQIQKAYTAESQDCISEQPLPVQQIKRPGRFVEDMN